MANSNRLSTSDSLKTHALWQKSVGHDPYRGEGEDAPTGIIPEVGEINNSAKGLFRLAQLTGQSSTLAPGACKKCGQVGHLFFQCRNYLVKNQAVDKPVEEDVDDDDPPSDAFDSDDDDDDDGDDDSESSSSSDSSMSEESDSSSSSEVKKKKKKKGKKDKKKSSSKKKVKKAEKKKKDKKKKKKDKKKKKG
mmetsp:Transcript_801/g.1329  ORF Transcript_801/g.1329 Transcript_801/m.1329 type:complete len:192 (-) Transcript_801:92-667(-)